MNATKTLYILLKQTSLLLDECERQLLEQFGMSVARFNLLQLVYENPSIGTSSLSKELHCHPSNITRLVRGAEKEGLIKRSRNQSDYRAVNLELTAEGKILYLRALVVHENYIQQQMRLFDQEEKQIMIDHLRPLYHALRQETENSSV